MDAKPYDEDYSYNADGGIMTLKRQSETAALQDDFTYDYYENTHKLRKLTATGALYEYDAIGNLVKNNTEGVTIAWTPYGKVRTTQKGDSVTTSYRYDAAGNRIEEKVVRANATHVTRYALDATGNIMAIYKDSVLRSQPLYGSTRLGEYRGSVKEGRRVLGHRTFELSNHLQNNLTTITDNVNMSGSNVWATVESATDYYPFGLEMKDRSFSSGAARFGFNGKEKDGNFGSTTSYNYGFRIYDPRTATFNSLDPLTASYPWYTPYQFAGNKPIAAIDIDGLEDQIAIDGTLKSGPFDMKKVNTEIVRQYVNSMKQAMNQQPVSRAPSASEPTLGPNPFANESSSTRQSRIRSIEYERNYSNFIKTGQNIDPFVFGGPGFGEGFAKTTAEGFKQAPGVVLPELAVAKFNQLRYLYSLTKVERGIVSETNTILKSSELGQIRAAHEAGKAIEVSVGGRTILYEPQLNSSGLSLFGENGFVIGKEAFKSEAELTKTILHELQRLNMSTSKAAGLTGEIAASETKKAFDFAEKTYNKLYK